MASLFVIQGADQGKRFELLASPMAMGRDQTNPIRLHDHEVSRRHAEVRPEPGGFRLVDLGSANGSFLNDRPIGSTSLKAGDRVRLGQTVMLFQDDGPPSELQKEMASRVNLLGRSSPDDRSAILRSIPAGEGSRMLTAPGSAGAWLKDRLANLAVMYQATQAISMTADVDALLPQILELVFESIGADRGAILLRDPAGELVPQVVRWRGEAPPDERLTISRTITDHVLEKGQGVITTDAPADKRFSPAASIHGLGIREAICVPIQGRHTTLGVLYADIRAANEFAAASELGRMARGGKFSRDHLKLMVAIGHQAGLAIENTELYQAKLQAERLAAVGQTIATLSHHIKNILQGIKGGSYLIDMGLKEKDDAIVRRGWTIVEKNQGKIYNLVMDMLSYSKDREPALEKADLNETVCDVCELMRTRADELGVALTWTPAADMPEIVIDPDGIHRAVLNLVTNALDAAEGIEGAKADVSTHWEAETGIARVIVADNGTGIAEDDLPGLFQIFTSTKGSRGTGLGLPVSQKIAREHGGMIEVRSGVGTGTTFIFELPTRRSPESRDSGEMATVADV
ncbi:FHA domain-containing protein [Isosphaeraceae bacterium EP7]